jgi:hypothetical protein
MKWHGMGSPTGLGPLAHFTSFDVPLDIMHKPWPPIIMEDQFQSLGLAWVACNGGVMVSGNDVGAKSFVMGDIKAIMVGYKTIRELFPTLFLLSQCIHN